MPDGVLIVLGSQTDQLDDMPSAVQASLKAERRIEIQPLSRGAVFSILEKSSLAQRLTDAEQEEVFARSDGHPLALRYMVNLLESATSREELEGMLRSVPRFEGSIEGQYLTYWRLIT